MSRNMEELLELACAGLKELPAQEAQQLLLERLVVVTTTWSEPVIPPSEEALR